MPETKAPAPAPKVRRTLTGVVVCNATDKTVRVRVERRTAHPLYGKVVRRRNHLLAHDADNSCAVGDTVTIAECRRHSKRKAWEVVTTTATQR